MSVAQPLSPSGSESARHQDVQKYVEAQKTAWTVCPIRPIPIKPEFPLYAHQVRAYNIALVLMGYDPEGGTDDDPA